MLITHMQTCDHTHLWHLLEEIIMATSHIRAENVAFSCEIGEVAAISADILLGKHVYRTTPNSCKYWA